MKEYHLIIITKCNSISDLSDNATAKEFKTVLTYIAKEANKAQRKLVGLDVE
ncbi:hypothetical protein EBA30_03130 [Streptococcus mutans]|nr:hypothetical protein EBA30_03130 [Streptococcus mutans]NLQ69158.1 hypothetical protein [Streptococcus mutans]NLQ80018.1 hypothetical protein [Streptococcus mutans]